MRNVPNIDEGEDDQPALGAGQPLWVLRVENPTPGDPMPPGREVLSMLFLNLTTRSNSCTEFMKCCHYFKVKAIKKKLSIYR